MRTIRYVMLIFLTIAINSCSKDGTPTQPQSEPPAEPDNTVASITVTPAGPHALVGIGSTLQLGAEARNAAGEIVDAEISWDSENEDVATVSNTGLVTATGKGQSNITALAGEISSEVDLTVEVGSAVIEGTMITLLTQIPVTDMPVVLEGEFEQMVTQTSEDGAYKFEGLTDGDYTIRFENPEPEIYFLPDNERLISVEESGVSTLDYAVEFLPSALYNPPSGWVTVCRYLEPVDSAAYECDVQRFSNYGYGDLESFIPSGSPIMGPITAERRSELESISEADRIELCLIDQQPEFASEEVAPIGRMNDGNRGNIAPIYDWLVGARAQYVFMENIEAGEFIVRNLRAWADAGSILGSEFTANGGAWLDSKILYFVMIRSWEAVRDTDLPSTEDITVIDHYLQDLRTEIVFLEGEKIDNGRPTGLDVFNHGWENDLAGMAYGILYNDPQSFQLGISRFFTILDGLIRPDGSHFFESQRGSAALNYSIGATSLMIRMADIANNQGYDLYSVEVNGVTLDDIINFHVDAVADNELIHQYTQYQNPQTCSPEQCANWNNQDFEYLPDFNFHAWADFEFVLERRNDSKTELFKQVFPWWDSTAVIGGPMYQSCELRDSGI